MATDDEVAVASAGSELKHLGFVRVLALQAIAWALNLYGAAKASLGDLQTVASRVEAAATVLVGPVYAKFKGLPAKVLQFLDNKIHAAAKIYDKYAPSFVKKIVSADLNATKLAIKAVQVARADGLGAAIRLIVGEINHAIQWLFAKSRQFLLALFKKISLYLMSYLVAAFLEATKTPAVQKALVSFIPIAIGLLNKSNLGITSVFGGITSAMDKSSAALSSVPLVGGATKAAAGVASAAQTTLTSAVEKSSAALTGIQLGGEPAKPAAAAETADSNMTEATAT